MEPSVPAKPKPPKSGFRKVIYTVHLYGGLLAVPYLIIFGVSSLDFNHHFLSKAKSSPVNWSGSFTPKPELSDKDSAAWIRDSLNLIGWIPNPHFRRIDEANIQFKVLHPGKNYIIRAQLKEGRAEVEEERQSMGYVLVASHGNRGVPGSSLMDLWAYYGQFCGLLVTFSAFSGVCLWWEAGRDRFSGTLILLIALAVSLAFLGWVI